MSKQGKGTGGNNIPIGRRDLLGGLALAAAGAGTSRAAPVGAAEAEVDIHDRALRIVDLTHELTSDYNFVPARPRIAMHPIAGSGYKSGMKLNLLSLVEHTGTHIDAPRHFDDEGASLGEIPIEDLAVPLAVIDFRGKVADNPGAAISVADVKDWESRHGRLPEGCCIAMNSGWDAFEVWRRMTTFPKETARQSPGFSPDVTEFLLEERNVKGLAVDVLSIDEGRNSPAYPVHQKWLRAGRWAIEGLANLQSVPVSGAILVVGAAPIKDATGIPIRALAIC